MDEEPRRGGRPSLSKEDAEELGRQIYELRTRLGITQEQFAERLGVSRAALSRWETGEAAPSALHLLAIQKARNSVVHSPGALAGSVRMGIAATATLAVGEPTLGERLKAIRPANYASDESITIASMIPDDLDMSEFGAWVKRVRKLASMSQGEFAEHVGASKSTVVRWEAGAGRPTARQIESMERVAYELERSGISTGPMVPFEALLKRPRAIPPSDATGRREYIEKNRVMLSEWDVAQILGFNISIDKRLNPDNQFWDEVVAALRGLAKRQLRTTST